MATHKFLLAVKSAQIRFKPGGQLFQRRRRGLFVVVEGKGLPGTGGKGKVTLMRRTFQIKNQTQSS
jgi:hypothetical protein